MGRFIHHFRWPVLIAWLAIALLLAAVAPKPDLTPGETTDLLPPTTPVHIALTKLAQHFGDKSALSNIVVVFQRESSSLTQDDLTQIESIATQIEQPQPSDLPATDLKSLSIHSPANFSLAGKSNPLISADQKAALIFITIPFNYSTKPAARLVEHTQQIIAAQKFPPGLIAAVTGSAGYGHDYARAIEHSHQKTLTVTLISLILILLFVYRAPIAAAIPLAAIGIAALAVFSLLSLLGPLGIEAGTAEQIFTFVLLYGAGVDYSLLFMSRYRELIELGTPHSASIAAALNDSLPAIYSSAGMTIAGLSMLYFAKFAVFHNSGPSVVLAVAAASLAATTLTPALLAIIGPRAFWPTHLHDHKSPASRRRVWPAIAKIVVNHPALIFLLTLTLLLPPAIRGLKIPWSYDALYTLKQTYPARQGADIIQSHWPIGEIGPVTLLAITQEPQSLESWTTTTSQIIEKIKSLPNIADIRALTQPLGSAPTATENSAMLLLNQEKIRTEFLSNDNQAMRLQIILTAPPLSKLAMETAPTIASAAQSAIDPKTEIYLTGTTAEMIDIRSTVQSDFYRVATLALTAILIVVILVLRDPLISLFILAATLLSYFATVGLTLWFFQSLGAHGLESRVQMLLFMVLVAVGQDYSIFFAVRLAQESRNLPPKPGSPWKLPTEPGAVDEGTGQEATTSSIETEIRRGEAPPPGPLGHKHGPRGVFRQSLATERALIFTGPVISSCGLIMAATLGSVMAGDVQTLIQLGFAFALGMLIDTFLVRPLLLPAFVVLTGRTLKHAAVASHALTAVPPV